MGFDQRTLDELLIYSGRHPSTPLLITHTTIEFNRRKSYLILQTFADGLAQRETH